METSLMPFDPSTAKPVGKANKPSGKFDPSTAKPINSIYEAPQDEPQDNSPQEESGSIFSNMPTTPTDSLDNNSLSKSDRQKGVDQLVNKRVGLTSMPANFSNLGQGALSTLRAIGTPFQVAESIPADVLLAMQRGDYSQLPQNLTQDIQGTRNAQFGDVLRSSQNPILHSEPVASTLGLLASMSPATPGGALGKLAGEGLGKVGAVIANHPVASPLIKFRNALGDNFNGALSKEISMATNATPQVAKDLVENPSWSVKKVADGMVASAKRDYKGVLQPLINDTSNVVPKTAERQAVLDSLNLFTKPQHVDDEMFNLAKIGDRAAISDTLNERLYTQAQQGNIGAAKKIEAGQLFTPEHAMTNPELYRSETNALKGMNQTQVNQLKDWYSRASKPVTDFNDANNIREEVNHANSSYWNAVHNGQISKGEAGRFTALSNQIAGSVTKDVTTSFPQVAPALEAYSKSFRAKAVSDFANKVNPGFFRSIPFRVALGAAGLHGPLNLAVSALGTVPAVVASALRTSNTMSQLLKNNPAVAAQLMRMAGQIGQNKSN